MYSLSRGQETSEATLFFFLFFYVWKSRWMIWKKREMVGVLRGEGGYGEEGGGWNSLIPLLRDFTFTKNHFSKISSSD